MTATATPTAAHRSRVSTTHRLTFLHLLRSEVIKIVSLRSTWWSLGITAAISVGMSLLVTAVARDLDGGYPAISAIVVPTQFTMLVAGILGAIVVTGEYSTGMIRSTLTAEPRRGAVLVAKSIVVAAVVAVTTVVVYAASILLTAPLVAQGIDWTTPEASTVTLAWGVAAMAAFTLIGVGFGFLIRSSAGAIAATVGVLFVLPIVFTMFAFAGESWRWIVDAAQYLPSNAAATLTSTGVDDRLPSVVALCGWVAGPLVLGWIALRSRDA